MSLFHSWTAWCRPFRANQTARREILASMWSFPLQVSAPKDRARNGLLCNLAGSHIAKSPLSRPCCSGSGCDKLGHGHNMTLFVPDCRFPGIRSEHPCPAWAGFEHHARHEAGTACLWQTNGHPLFAPNNRRVSYRAMPDNGFDGFHAGDDARWRE
jgi:hypothetical protein